jgi:hypothetical protein
MSARRLLLRARRDESGQILPMIALMMVVLIGFLALAVDVGNAYLHKRRLQAAVDLALVSSAQSLPDTTSAIGLAKSYTDTNWHKRDDTNPAETVTTGCLTAGCTKQDQISLTATVDVPTVFLKLFGIDKWSVRAKGTACGPCDSTQAKFDVMVVLDRSYSMCLDSDDRPNNCADLAQAVDGIKSLLGFFNPATDHVGLTLLSSGDDHSPSTYHVGSNAPRCDGADPTDAYASGKGPFYDTVGDFMDGTAASHDTWVVAPLDTTFKSADGSLNASSPIVSTLNCVQPKFWTPIAPAIKEATDALIAAKGDGAKQYLIYMGDGGANVQPMKRDSNGNVVTVGGVQQTSWYTPTAGNNLQPCHDAVAQAARAKANAIEVYTIGYDLNASSANRCVANNQPDVGTAESGIDARSAMTQMATDSSHFYEKATPGEVYSIFNTIGHQITGSGVRLTN